jgi:hypothetical protein
MSQDSDGDGVHNGKDNCISLYNPAQKDGDGDEVGDACDLCPEQAVFGEPYGCPYDTETAARPGHIERLVARIRAEEQNRPCAVEASLTLEDPTWTPAADDATTLQVWLTNTTMQPVTMTWPDGCPCGGVSIGTLSGLPPVDDATCQLAREVRLQRCQNMGQCNPERATPSMTLAPGERKVFPETLVLQRSGHDCDYDAFPAEGGPASYAVRVTPAVRGALPPWRHPVTRASFPAPPVACPAETPLVIPGGR